MRVLRQGVQGPDVEAWEHFLVGREFYLADVDGNFDTHTKSATIAFQLSVGLRGDGEVGINTLGAAGRLGFDPLEDDSDSEFGPNWPPRPTDLVPFTPQTRAQALGQFAFRAAPTALNREGIIITDGWDQKNIVMVEIPQLENVVGAPSTNKVQFHKDLAEPVQALFAAWEEAGFRELIKTWAGSWSPRFIRGSSTVLSNHSWASAFDVNVPWNGLGAKPALVGREGSVRRLVPVALELGWWWGGFFTRKDGMHFEATTKALR